MHKTLVWLPTCAMRYAMVRRQKSGCARCSSRCHAMPDTITPLALPSMLGMVEIIRGVDRDFAELVGVETVAEMAAP